MKNAYSLSSYLHSVDRLRIVLSFVFPLHSSDIWWRFVVAVVCRRNGYVSPSFFCKISENLYIWHFCRMTCSDCEVHGYDWESELSILGRVHLYCNRYLWATRLQKFNPHQHETQVRYGGPHTPERRVAASTLRRYSFGLRLTISQADARPVMTISFN